MEAFGIDGGGVLVGGTDVEGPTLVVGDGGEPICCAPGIKL